MPEQKKGPPERSKTKSPRPMPIVEGESLRSVGSRNFSPKKPDWDYWKKLDLWTLGQAVCLICSCEPEGLESYDHPLSPRFRPHLYEKRKSKELRSVYKLALNSLEAGRLTPFDHNESLDANLNTRIDPGKFITWAKNKDVIVPKELEGLAHTTILSYCEVDAGHPTLKRIEELEEQEFKNNPPQKETSQTPSDRELTDIGEWMHYSELKARWGNKPDEKLIPLLHNIRLYAYKFSPPSPGWRDIAPPFDRYEVKPDSDLKNCYFLRFHVAQKERDYSERIGKKQEQGLDRVAEEAQNLKPDSIKQDSEAPRDPTIKAKNDEILKNVTLTVDSEGEINLQTNKGKSKQRFTANSLGFRDITTLECKALLEILETGQFHLGVSRVSKTGPETKEYGRNRKRIGELNKKLTAFFRKEVPGFCEIKGYRAFNTNGGIVIPKFNTVKGVRDDSLSYLSEEEFENVAKALDEQTPTDEERITEVWSEAKRRGYEKFHKLFPNTNERLKS